MSKWSGSHVLVGREPKQSLPLEAYAWPPHLRVPGKLPALCTSFHGLRPVLEMQCNDVYLHLAMPLVPSWPVMRTDNSQSAVSCAGVVPATLAWTLAAMYARHGIICA